MCRPATPKPSNNPPPSNNPRFNPWESPQDHQIYLQSNELFRWLCALAVAEQPDWALTIAIGRALGIEVTHDRLLRLSRIPWLADNESYTGLRLALLRELDPADERLAREAVAEELAEARKHTDLTGSFAENEWVANMAVQRFALDPRDDEHKKSIRELQEIGLLSEGQLTELDFIVRERADKKGLPGGAADSLDDWLDTPEPKPVFTRELGLAVGLIVFSLVLYLLGWSYHSRNLEAEPGYQAAFWQSARPLDDRALQLNNLAVGIGGRSDSLRVWQSWQARGDSLSLADSLLGLAVRLRSPDDYLLADSNQISLRFNIAARRLNFFLTDSADAGGLQRNADEFMLALPPTYPGDPRRLAALHGHGLCLYYLGAAGDSILLDSARRVRDRLLSDSGGAFFDSIRSETPVNLATLLAALSDPAEQTGSSDTAPDQAVDKRRDYATIRLGDKIWLAENLSLYVPGARCYDAAAVDCEQYGLLYTWPQALNACQALGAGWRLPSEAEWREMVLSFGGYFDWYTKETTGSATEAYRKLMVGGESGFNAMLGGLKISEGGSYDVDINGDYWTSTDYTAAQAWNYNFNNETGGTVTRVVNPKSWAFSCRCVQDVAPPAQTQDTPVAPPLNALRGRVLDAAAREPLANVQIVINGQTFVSQSGTGAYVLNDSVDQTPPLRLRFSLAGYQTQDATLSPNRGNTLPDVLLEKTGGGDLPLPEMVSIPGGTFDMGCLNEERDGGSCGGDEKPPHEARIRSFAMSRYEVTNTEFAAFLNDYGSDKVKDGAYAGQTMIYSHEWGVEQQKEQWLPAPGYERHPVVSVTWYGAYTYAQWLKAKTGENYRLPTEAEWEYAARGGAKGGGYRYAGSNDIEEVAWYRGNSYDKGSGDPDYGTHPVGRKKPNELGLYDMTGNVWEWCQDWYNEKYYAESPVDNPLGPNTGTYRVLRGGSWSSFEVGCRLSMRSGLTPDLRDFNLGFRLARD